MKLRAILFLLYASASFSTIEDISNTPLAKAKSVQEIKDLIIEGENIFALDEQERNLLHHFVRYDSPQSTEILFFLCGQHVNSDQRSLYGYKSPLHVLADHAPLDSQEAREKAAILTVSFANFHNLTGRFDGMHLQPYEIWRNRKGSDEMYYITKVAKTMRDLYLKKGSWNFKKWKEETYPMIQEKARKFKEEDDENFARIMKKFS